MLHKVIKYIVVWWIASRSAAQVALSNQYGAVLFLTAKVIRFSLFFLFLFILVEKTRVLAGYTTNQVLFFFITFNLIDVVSQMFFREVYRFRPQILTGNFDLVLSRPISPLFRALMGGTDVLDLITLPPLIILAVFIGSSLSPSPASVVFYIILICNAFLITAAFHIAVLALGIMTTAIDHTIMIYRDLVAMGRIPIDFYKEPVRGFLTYIIPVGIMMTVPAKVLMGFFDLRIVVYSFVFSVVALSLSLYFWSKALRSYSSASS